MNTSNMTTVLRVTSVGNRFRVCAALLVLLLPLVAAAVDHSGPLPRGESDWDLSVMPYVTLASQAADLGGSSIRQSFTDLASLTKLYLQGRLDTRWRWLRFRADGTYARLSSTAQIGPMTTGLTVNQSISDLRLGIRILDNRDDGEIAGTMLDVYLGARYWETEFIMDLSLDLEFLGEDPWTSQLDADPSWWDPLIGVSASFPINEMLSFNVTFAGGGFGIGNGSDFFFDLESVATFRISKLFALNAGYRHLRYTRTDGSGDNEIETKFGMFGPMLGATFIFF